MAQQQPAYAELHCLTNFSFLTGASHADELIRQADAFGYHALAITDENSLAGVVRAHTALRELKQTASSKLKLIIGAELVARDVPPLVVWATDRPAYANLSKLLTVGRRRAPKGQCWLELDDISNFATGLIAGVQPGLADERPRTSHINEQHSSHDWFRSCGRSNRQPDTQASRFNRLHEIFGNRLYLLAQRYAGPNDEHRMAQLQKLSVQTGLPLVAAGDVLYHSPQRQPLQDVLTAIKHHTTVDEAGDLLLPNAQRHLHSIEDRKAQFWQIPDAVQRTVEIADRCQFSLDELRYQYPEELAPAGKTPLQYLIELAWRGARRRYPQGIPDKVRRMLEHELQLIDELHYEAYFLTVWDLVRFARQRHILCQGRGSAANSAVCYCLGITSVDPNSTDLLFERFISRERDEAPDIDVDFEHERREEVLQYLYEKYGRERAGLAATVITYRSRSAIRDVGKAMGLSLDRIDSLAKQVDGYQNLEDLTPLMQATGIDPHSLAGHRWWHLSTEILGFPRHLSQHVGGMVITRGRLDELVPIENAAMEDRTVIQWDKDDLESLGLLKVDCLCLGMLTAIRKCFALVKENWGDDWTLATIPPDDPSVYDMICAADTVGVFQIESRGQMSMLPRLKPRCWYDLVIEVAIVRPGPIQGNMVHPYLRRRNGEEVPEYPNEEIRAVLDRTLGVPIFQEQAMKLAVVAAGFTPGEADQLRRAMGAWRKTGVIETFRTRLLSGMRQRGLSDEFAEQVFRQIRGFGEYGFPESHAASFALLVYVSAFLKHYYPAAFTTAILNSLPMGFYAPAQLIADARRHRVAVLPVDVNASHWDHQLEQSDALSPFEPGCVSQQPALRLGFRQIKGMRIDTANRIMIARTTGGPFVSMADFGRRTRLGQAIIAQLSQADAFHSLNQDRRESLWQALAQDKHPADRPLLEGLEEDDHDQALLPALSPQEEVFADYRSVGLSLRAHPVSFYRRDLVKLGVLTAAELTDTPDNHLVSCAGLVILRQRPSTAKGITFVTLEDETGTANLVVKQPVWQRYYQIAKTCPGWIARGRLEKRSGVIHLVVSRLTDLAAELGTLKTKSRDFR